MSETMATPTRRMSPATLAPRQFAGLARLDASVEIDHSLRELLRVRASQINGCAFCIDMHWTDARAAGETEQRLYSLDAWRESTCYSERERAALALCEAITLVAATHVPDDVWYDAESVFEPGELAQVVWVVIAINAWNRLVITSRTPPGSGIAA